MRAPSAVVAALIAALAARAEAGPTGSPASFAFADQSGRRLLTFGLRDQPIEDPKALDLALCADGSAAAVEYDHHQPSSGVAGRETAANFDKLEGHLYRLASPAKDLAADTTCLLVRSDGGSGARISVLRSRRSSAGAGPRAACPAALVDRIERGQKRRATTCWLLGDAAKEHAAAFAFVEGGRVPLAVLVYEGPEGAFVREQRAEPGSEASCWRADDGCQIDPERFVVLVVHARAKTRLIVLDAGLEGQIAEWVELRDGQMLPLLQADRYWSPE